MLKKIRWEYNNKHLTWLRITKPSPEEIYIKYIHGTQALSKACALFGNTKSTS